MTFPLLDRLLPWSCQLCTLVNAGAAKACAACESPRLGPASSSGSAAAFAAASVLAKANQFKLEVDGRGGVRGWKGADEDGLQPLQGVEHPPLDEVGAFFISR